MDTFSDIVAPVIANPTDRLPQLIWSDWLDERGAYEHAELIRKFGIFKRLIGYDDGGGYGYGGDGYGYGGDGGDGDDGGGYGYGGGGYGDGGDGDGGYGDGGDGDGRGYSAKTIPEGLTMKNGLHIITIPAGYYPYVMVGWAERDDIFIRMKNCRIIRSFGSSAELSVMAVKGPQKDTVLLTASKEESVPITSIGRSISCDPEKWRKECPNPDGN